VTSVGATPRGVGVLSRIAELERRAPRGAVWYLENGSVFRSHLTDVELIMRGEQQIRRGGPHPIYDAARRTVRAEGGSRFHELLIAVCAPIIRSKKRKPR